MSPPAAGSDPPNPVPPGRTGLPLLGETLSFVKDGFGFIARRTADHGPVWKTHLLGRPTAVLVGPDAAGRFLDQEVQRAGAMPPHVEELFGGICLPLLDGSPHGTRKRLILEAFGRAALAGYLPEMERATAEALARWAAQPEVALVPETKRLALEVICATVLGLPPGPETGELRRDYDAVLRAFGSLPLPLPGSAFNRGRAALGRILARFTSLVAARRRQALSHLSDQSHGQDGLSRILAATAADPGQLSDQACAVELHHLIVAGFIVFAELAAMVLELTRHPEIRARLQAEIAGLPDGPGLSPATLAAAPYLLGVVMEVKRLCPVVPVVFGKARQSFEFAGHTVPEGWMVLWAVHASQRSPEVYTEPERFDPERFAPGRDEHLRHPHGFTPQGAGSVQGHKCAGIDFSTCLMEIFAIALLRGYTWDLSSDQDLGLDWSRIPPEPRSGLRLRLSRGAERSPAR